MKRNLLFIAMAFFGLMNQFNAQVTYTINTFAGTGTGTSTGDGGLATAATLNYPHCIAVDAAGNVYVSELSGNKIRKINTSGIISLFAGTGAASSTGDGGLATAATLNQPAGMSFDGAGNLYVTEFTGHRIRKINTSGIISTVVGTGVSGFSGDGGLAAAAQIFYPIDVKADAPGNLYFTDSQNNRIRMVNTSGIISTIIGNGTATSTGDGGLANAATINYPSSVYFNGTNMYICELTGNRVRMVNSGGIISTVVGNGTPTSTGDGGLATAATVNNPGTVLMDGGGNLLVTEYQGARIRSINSGGIISTAVGNGVGGFGGDGGVATAAQINGPFEIAMGTAGQIYFAEYLNNRVRVLTAASCTTAVTASVTATNATCFGQANGSATVSAVGGGPFTYTWIPSGGFAATASGLTAGSYTVIVKNSCGNTTIVPVNISQPSMLISTAAANPNSICAGGSSTLTGFATGGTPSYSYSWTPGGAITNSTVVTPSVTTNYSFVTQDGNGCMTTYTLFVFVNTPSVTAVSSTSLLCIGQNATLTASGASTYTWSTASTNTAIVISPSVTTSYTVVGTNSGGCIGGSIITQSVSTCVGVNELGVYGLEFGVYPNPTKGEFVIRNAGANTRYEIYSSLGQLVQKNDLNAIESKIILNEKPGVYFVKILDGTKLVKVEKLVKE